jgi:hypothetical protein
MNLLSNEQCVFRRYSSTVDHFVNLVPKMQNAFLLPHHLISVFVDLEKEYKSTWQSCILVTFHRWNFRRPLIIFILNFRL